jgi:hypothetical protein
MHLELCYLNGNFILAFSEIDRETEYGWNKIGEICGRFRRESS